MVLGVEFILTHLALQSGVDNHKSVKKKMRLNSCIFIYSMVINTLLCNAAVEVQPRFSWVFEFGVSMSFSCGILL